MKYTTTKLFDCQDMPTDIRRKFLESCNEKNDIIVEYYVYSNNQYCTIAEFEEKNIDGKEIVCKEIEDGIVYYNQLGDDIVSDWLYQNGADVHEEVCIKHWW